MPRAPLANALIDGRTQRAQQFQIQRIDRRPGQLDFADDVRGVGQVEHGQLLGDCLLWMIVGGPGVMHGIVQRGLAVGGHFERNSSVSVVCWLGLLLDEASVHWRQRLGCSRTVTVRGLSPALLRTMRNASSSVRPALSTLKCVRVRFGAQVERGAQRDAGIAAFGRVVDAAFADELRRAVLVCRQHAQVAGRQAVESAQLQRADDGIAAVLVEIALSIGCGGW
jgi:hypothetical protein